MANNTNTISGRAQFKNFDKNRRYNKYEIKGANQQQYISSNGNKAYGYVSAQGLPIFVDNKGRTFVRDRKGNTWAYKDEQHGYATPYRVGYGVVNKGYNSARKGTNGAWAYQSPKSTTSAKDNVDTTSAKDDGTTSNPGQHTGTGQHTGRTGYNPHRTPVQTTYPQLDTTGFSGNTKDIYTNIKNYYHGIGDLSTEAKDFLTRGTIGDQNAAQFYNNAYAHHGGRTFNPVSASNPTTATPVATTAITPATQQYSYYSPFSNDDIRNLGFHNYSSLYDAAKSGLHNDNSFMRAMYGRYGNDVSKWNQQNIERDLDVSGQYHNFGGGDFGDISRNMSAWIGGQNGQFAAHQNYNNTTPSLQTTTTTPTTGVSTTTPTSTGIPNYRNYNTDFAGKFANWAKNSLGIGNNNTTTQSDVNMTPDNKSTYLHTRIPSYSAKQGGKLNNNMFYYNKYQDGGEVAPTNPETSQPDSSDQAEQIKAYLQQAPEEEREQFIQGFQQYCQDNNIQTPSDNDLVNFFQEIQNQKGQDQAQLARRGAKLNFIKRLKGDCPEGQELVYYKAGGRICKACMGRTMKKGGKTTGIERGLTPTEQFKNDRALAKANDKSAKKASKRYTINYDGGKKQKMSVGGAVKQPPIPSKNTKVTKQNVNSRLHPSTPNTNSIVKSTNNLSKFQNVKEQKCGGKTKVKKHYFGGKIDSIVVNDSLNRLTGRWK